MHQGGARREEWTLAQEIHELLVRDARLIKKDWHRRAKSEYYGMRYKNKVQPIIVPLLSAYGIRPCLDLSAEISQACKCRTLTVSDIV
jgi:hypothetical protein